MLEYTNGPLTTCKCQMVRGKSVEEAKFKNSATPTPKPVGGKHSKMLKHPSTSPNPFVISMNESSTNYEDVLMVTVNRIN